MLQGKNKYILNPKQGTYTEKEHLWKLYNTITIVIQSS